MSQDLHSLFAPYAAAPARPARRAARAVASLVLLTVAFMAALRASSAALPGDVLYPLKRGVEQAALLTADTPADEARLHLRFAGLRLHELELVRHRDPDAIPRLASAALTELQPLGTTPAATTLRRRAFAALAPYLTR